ncbi:MAG: homocysteine S-methyltransferase family protein [Desulfobacterales bacterium]
MPNLLIEIIKQRPLIFDGAMGTMLMEAGQGSLKTPILLNQDEPELVAAIHRQYYDAGADVVITNTFGGSPLKLSADGLEQQMAELNRNAVKLTRQACPDGKFVAGDIGPSGKMLQPLGDVAPEDMQEASGGPAISCCWRR